MSDSVTFKHHDTVKTPERTPRDRIVECTRDLADALRGYPQKDQMECGEAIDDLKALLRGESVDIPKSNRQLQRQQERQMPAVAPEQIPAATRTDKSSQHDSQTVILGKLETL